MPDLKKVSKIVAKLQLLIKEFETLPVIVQNIGKKDKRWLSIYQCMASRVITSQEQ